MTRLARLIPAACALTVALASAAAAVPAAGISGAVEWDRMAITAEISLDLAASGLRLPAGRMQGEAMLAAEYLRLIRSAILGIQVDSASSVADLIARGEWSLTALERLAMQARTVPPAMTPELDGLRARYTLDVGDLSAAFIRHVHPADVPRTLLPVATQAFTGVVIIAADTLQIHGREGSALVRPALFPRLWDDGMNLIFERNMLEPGVAPMVRYFPRSSLFAGGPSGLSPELAAVVGERPLRIFAEGVFGEAPTDPVISRDDALLIISSAENRALLSTGRVAVVVDDSVLRSPFAAR